MGQWEVLGGALAWAPAIARRSRPPAEYPLNRREVPLPVLFNPRLTTPLPLSPAGAGPTTAVSEPGASASLRKLLGVSE